VKQIQNILAKKEEVENNEKYPAIPSARKFENSRQQIDLQYRN